MVLQLNMYRWYMCDWSYAPFVLITIKHAYWRQNIASPIPSISEFRLCCWLNSEELIFLSNFLFCQPPPDTSKWSHSPPTPDELRLFNSFIGSSRPKQRFGRVVWPMGCRNNGINVYWHFRKSLVSLNESEKHEWHRGVSSAVQVNSSWWHHNVYLQRHNHIRHHACQVLLIFHIFHFNNCTMPIRIHLSKNSNENITLFSLNRAIWFKLFSIHKLYEFCFAKRC